MGELAPGTLRSTSVIQSIDVSSMFELSNRIVDGHARSKAAGPPPLQLPTEANTRKPSGSKICTSTEQVGTSCDKRLYIHVLPHLRLVVSTNAAWDE